MAVDKNGKSFLGSEGTRVRVHADAGSYDGIVLGTYQKATDQGEAVEGDVLPHVEQEDGTRSMPAAHECELLEEGA